MKLTARELIKLILAKEFMTQKDLVLLLNEQMGKKYYPETFSRKLTKGTITYNEIVDILDSLGYEIEWKKKD